VVEHATRTRQRADTAMTGPLGRTRRNKEDLA
jgi:hypothetical protein